MGIYTVRAEGHCPDGPGDGRIADFGIVLVGVEVINNLQSVSHAENPDGPGLSQAFTKCTGTETQIAPGIWLAVMH